MEKYTVAFFSKSQWVEAFQWQNARVAEGYDIIASNYTPNGTVKIASKTVLTDTERRELSDKVLRGEIG